MFLLDKSRKPLLDRTLNSLFLFLSVSFVGKKNNLFNCSLDDCSCTPAPKPPHALGGG